MIFRIQTLIGLFILFCTLTPALAGPMATAEWNLLPQVEHIFFESGKAWLVLKGSKEVLAIDLDMLQVILNQKPKPVTIFKGPVTGPGITVIWKPKIRVNAKKIPLPNLPQPIQQVITLPTKPLPIKLGDRVVEIDAYKRWGIFLREDGKRLFYPLPEVKRDILTMVEDEDELKEYLEEEWEEKWVDKRGRVGPYTATKDKIYFGLQGGFPKGEGSFGGIAIFDLKKKDWNILRHPYILFNTATALYLKGDQLWIGGYEPGEYEESGRYGLVIYNLKTGNWQNLSKQNKTLTGNMVREMAEEHSRIWVSTEYGIDIYDSKEKAWFPLYWKFSWDRNGEIKQIYLEEGPWEQFEYYKRKWVTDFFIKTFKVRDTEGFNRQAEVYFKEIGYWVPLDPEAMKWNSQFIPFLIPSLNDTNPHLRALTARILGRLKEFMALPSLKEALVTEKVQEVKRDLERAVRSIEETWKFETHQVRFGPLNIGKEKLTVIATMKRISKPEVTFKQTLEAFEIVDGKNRPLYRESYHIPQVRGEKGFEEELGIGPVFTLEGKRGTGLMIRMEWVPSAPSMGVSYYILGFDKCGNLLPLGPPLTTYGGLKEMRKEISPQSLKLFEGDRLKFRVWTGNFSVIVPLLVDWENMNIHPVALEGEFEVKAHRNPQYIKYHEIEKTTISLFSKPKTASPSVVLKLQKTSKVEFLKAHCKVNFEKGYVDVSEVWLKVQVDGTEGWTDREEDFNILGLPSAG